MQTLGDHSLDLLMCNAGIMACPMTFSNYGVEMQYAVNHLSHARLTMRLMPSLREHHGGRVIFVSSMAVAFARSRKSAPRLDEKARDVVTDANYAKWAAYGDSKLAMSLFAKAVAQKEHNVESVSLHPGIVQTELGRYIVPEKLIPLLGKDPGFLGKAMSVFGFKTPDQGADLSVELAGLKRGGLQNGELYMKSGTLAEKSIAPLLSEKKEWEAVYDDVVKFMDWA